MPTESNAKQNKDALALHIRLAQLENNNQQLQSTNQNLRANVDALQEQNQMLMQRVKWFEEQIKLSRHRQYGKQSETAQSLMLPIFDDNEADEVKETVEPIDDEHEQVTYSRKKRGGSQRNIDTSKLPREQVIHDLADADKACSCCGEQLQQIGEDKSEKIDYIPAQLKVIEHITPKYACRACETIKAAKKPEQPLQKVMATLNFVVDVILKKYDEHLPLYRQSKILLRDGIDIPDNTLGNWVMAAAEALTPLMDALWAELPKSHYIQADETPVKILKPDKKGYMWVYQGLDAGNRFVAFEFNQSRGACVPENRLEQFAGLLQTDGYYGYSQIGRQKEVTHLGCWDHARRKFVSADKVSGSKGKGVAAEFIKLIAKLYRIERKLKDAPAAERYKTRQEDAKPILEQLFIKANSLNALPKSQLATSIT